MLQLCTVDTNPCPVLLSHGVEDYVWDGHRCSLPSWLNAGGVNRWQVGVPRQLRKVQCEGMERGKRGNAKHGRGVGAFNAWKKKKTERGVSEKQKHFDPNRHYNDPHTAEEREREKNGRSKRGMSWQL
jgi:hypothetical protein